MVNDTTTLNGALAELGETMAANLTQQGVTSSASEGLTTLAGKILDIQTGGSCYHIEFSEDSYVAVGGSATLEIYLQENYAPKTGATVTVTGSDSSLYTGITDSTGVATVTVTGLTDTTSFTCSYSNVTDTATVTVQQGYLFYDDCSSDRTSDYELLSTTAFYNQISTFSYDSTNHCYNLSTGGAVDKNYGIAVKNLNVGSCKITAKVQVNSTQNVQIGVGLHNNSDTTVQIVSRILKINNTTSIIRVDPDTSIASTNQTISTNTWYTIEFTNDNGSLTYKLYNDSGTLLKTLTGSTNLLSASNNTPFVFFSYSSNKNGKFKELKVEAL